MFKLWPAVENSVTVPQIKGSTHKKTQNVMAGRKMGFNEQNLQNNFL